MVLEGILWCWKGYGNGRDGMIEYGGAGCGKRWYGKVQNDRAGDGMARHGAAWQRMMEQSMGREGMVL